MGIDKYKAIHQKYRIRESTLLMIMYLGGMWGSFIGMLLFHHKTRKLKFIVTVFISLIIHIVLYTLLK